MGLLPSRRAKRPADGLPASRIRGVNIEDPYHLRSSGLIRGGGGLPPGARRRACLWCFYGLLRLAFYGGLMTLGALLWKHFGRGEPAFWQGSAGGEPHVAEVRAISTALRPPGGPRPRSSTFECLGHKWEEREDLNYLYLSCKFHDVCLNHSTLQLEYYQPPGAPEEPLFYAHTNGLPHTTFPSDFLMTGHVQVQPLEHFGPKVVRGGLPPKAVYHPAPVVVYASLNDFIAQLTHALYDLVMPVFNLLQLFRTYSPDFLLLEAKHQGQDMEAAGLLIRTDDPERSLLRLITRRPPLSRAEVVAQAPPEQGLTCFHTLLAGTGHLQESEARTRTSAFWAAAMVSLGIRPPPRPPHGPGPKHRPSLMVILKAGARAIENAGELAEALHARFPEADVQALDGSSLAGLTVRQRMELLMGVDILFTPGGDLAALPALLRPGATAIIPNYLQATTGASVQADVDYFWNLDHVTLEYLPVGREDYKRTSDRPGCELSPKDATYETLGPLVNCNVWLTDQEALFHLVARALRRLGVHPKA